jgi:nucleoid DNA-binding protein
MVDKRMRRPYLYALSVSFSRIFPRILKEGLMAENKARPLTKSAVYQELAAKTGLTRKQVNDVFEGLTNLIKRELSKKGAGVFALAGLLKIKRVNKPATKERMGRNPATGEPMMIKAKPARTVVKSLPLKSLKEFVK